MPISFSSIPANELVPFLYAEFDNSKANSALNPSRTLIIGQITAGGVATPNVAVQCAGPGDAKTQGGLGSMIADMAAAYYANDPFGEVWLAPLSDAGGAVAATGTLALTGASTAAGVIALYVAGQLVSVPIASGTAAAAAATAIAAAVTLQSDLPVTAAAVTGTVTFTAKNKGLAGNDIDIRLNYLGTRGGEATPAGLAPVITAMANGVTNPTLTTMLANLGDKSFDVIVSPYSDATSIAALSAFLGDAAGRWSFANQTFGGCWMAYRGTYAGLGTFAVGLNDQHLCNVGFNDSPSPVWKWASAFAGFAAVSLRADPSVPLQGVAVMGLLAPPLASRFTLAQRNALLAEGVSTWNVVSGQIFAESMVTTYQLNAQGQPDNSYRYPETLYTLAFLLRDLRTKASSVFGRTKLAASGTRYAPGANVSTPNTIRAWIISWYQAQEAAGLVQQSDVFAQALSVEINANNPARCDVLLPLILVSGLRVMAIKVQFRFS